MLMLQTAWKNLFRYKRRSYITAGAIAVGVMFSIIFDGMLFGIGRESERNIIWHESGSAKFFPAGYFQNRHLLPTDILLEHDQVAEIARIAESAKAPYAPRFLTNAQAYFTEEYFPAAGSINVILAGVDTNRDHSVFHSLNNISAGKTLQKGTGVVLGNWLAEDMKAEVGYYFTIEVKGRGGFYQTFDVPIIGITQTDNPYVNGAYVFMDYDYLDEMLELNGAVSEVAVMLENSGSASGTAKVLPPFHKAFEHDTLAQSGAVELYDWNILYADALSIDKSKSAVSGLLMVFIFIIAAVGISNTMLMAVMERKNEVAMLKALGYSTLQVKLLFMYEGLFIGMLGAAAGLILGLIGNYYMIYYGMDFTFMLRGTDFGYRITGVMRSAWHTIGIIQITLGALVVSAVSAYLPTGNMLKREIADLFRKI